MTKKLIIVSLLVDAILLAGYYIIVLR
jgi:hypothetical protein